MDCFFASVAGLTDPSFWGKPLAVSHSNSAQGTGEISSANYEARKFGIKASMFIAEGKKRCPHLIVMPYQFEKYEDVSEQVGCAFLMPYQFEKYEDVSEQVGCAFYDSFETVHERNDSLSSPHCHALPI